MTTDEGSTSKPWYKKWWAITLGVIVVIGVLGNLGDSEGTTLDAGGTTTTVADVVTSTEAPTATTTAPDTTTTTGQSTTTTTTTVPESQFTRSEENAIRSAEQYLSISAFSRSGLIDQLEFEGFTTEQATYGVDKAGL